MTIAQQRKIPVLIVAAVAVAAMGLGGCGGGGSGGGGGGSGSSSGSPLISAIRLLNVPSNGTFQTIELWNSNAGAATPNPPANVPLNVAIEIEFAGSVSPSSVPSGGIAIGTINITTTDGITTTPAAGSFGVSDAPNGPSGNNRIVTFLPTPPTDPNNPATTAGLGGNLAYTVFIPRSGNSSQVVMAGGAPLQNEAVAAFITCDPNAPAGAQACFTDPVPGPPHVVMTIPASNDPAPPAVDPTSVQNNTVTAFISEPLFPQGIDLNNVRLINAASGAQVPGSVQFFQAGTPEAGPNTARIDYIASSQLLANVTYELVLDPAIADFGGNPVVLYDPNDPNAAPSGQRFFLTIPITFCPQTPISDSFDSTANRDTVTGITGWPGSGMITSTFPFSLTGDGTFGDLTFTPGPQSLDTGMVAQTGFVDGNWDTLNLTVPAGATVRAQGNFRAHIRCLGAADISGTINGNAGINATAPTGSPEQGPGAGAFNNGGNAANSLVRGGVGGVGGGAGGAASQDGYTTRTNVAQSGFGPTDPVTGAPNPGPFGANTYYGGGQGGDGDFRFPSGGMMGNTGGVGGAGGSAWQAGNDGQPFSAPAAGCLAQQPTIQPISAATPVPAVFVTPILVASAGSGGGGGGDRFELTGATNDDQGGGAGGGGGGFRISAVQALTINAGASLTFNGAGGAAGNLFFAGGGGGGSGGQIWLQSFLDLAISSSAQLSVNPGAAANTCSDHASGAGGFGMYQLEDPDGMVNTGFQPIGGGTGGANIITLQFPFDAANTGGTATSIFFDTGYGDPDYDPSTVMEVTSLGANPPTGASIVVEYQGAFEALSGGQPDLTSLSPWVTGPNLDQIDGFRYVRFRIVMSIPTPNTTGTGTLPSNSLPTADFVSFGFSTPIGCNP